MATPENLVPDMTSATAPSGVVTTSYEASATYAAWKVFDRDAATYWKTQNFFPEWVQYEFENATICTAYAITTSLELALYSPIQWRLYGSTTGAFAGEEDELHYEPNAVFTPGERKEYSFTNTTEYKYYRVVILNDASIYGAYIAGVELIGVKVVSSNITGSLTMDASPLPPAISTATGSLTASATATKRLHDYGFQVVGKIQNSLTTQTHTLVGIIEKRASSTTVKRINS